MKTLTAIAAATALTLSATGTFAQEVKPLETVKSTQEAGLGAGLGVGATVGLVAVSVLAIAVALGGGSSDSTTTSSSPGT